MRRIILLVFTMMLVGLSSYAQDRTIKGKVTSSQDGLPVIGASVFVKGSTKLGTVTDIDGNFKLVVPKSAKVFVVKYLGMEDKEVSIKPIMNIILDPAQRVLDEVVVVGITKMDKRLFTGAATKVDGEKAKLDGVPDAARALEGRAAGVSVQNVSGTFGTSPKIRIRGATSIFGSSKPLWVVDGVVVDDVVNLGPDDLSSGDATTLISNAIAGLNPDDIESFQVLKDGSATSIYGARAMAGVIVITTKKGRAGASKISYIGEYTYRMKPSYNNFNIMNSQQQMSIYNELYEKGLLSMSHVVNSSTNGVYGKMYDLINRGELLNRSSDKEAFLRQSEYRNTNWFDLLFRNNILNTHSISLSSGTDKVQFYSSVSLLSDEGWTLQSKVKRLTASFNVNYKIYKDLSLNLSANTSSRVQRSPGTLSSSVDHISGEVSRNFDINPFSFAMNTSRTLDPKANYRRMYAPFNIFHELENNYINSDVFDFKTQLELTWKPIKGLTVSALGALKKNVSVQTHVVTEFSNRAESWRADSTTVIRDANSFLYKDLNDPKSVPVSVLPKGGFNNEVKYLFNSWDARLTAQYTTKFFDDDLFSLFAGAEANSIDRSALSVEMPGILYDEGLNVDFDYHYYEKLKKDGSNPYELSSSKYRNLAFYTNLSYTFLNRYTLNTTLRYEGNNNFSNSAKSRWIPTWNVSGSWDVTNESFFDYIRPVMSSLKLKASYSLTADRGPSFVNNSTSIYKANISWRRNEGDRELGYELSLPENASLTYEKKHEFNFGFESGFFNNRVNVLFDVYNRNNYDLIGRITTQGITGASVQYGNVASMKSYGCEFSISTLNVKTKDFSWSSDFVYSKSKNRITKLYTTNPLYSRVAGSGFAQEGYPVRSLLSIPFAGLNKLGFPTFYTDKDHKNVTLTDINFQQREGIDFLKYEGSVDPTDFGSFGNTFKYKNFEFNVFLTYSFGNVVRLYPVFSSSYNDLSSTPREFDKRWVKSGDENITNIPVIPSLRDLKNNRKLRYAYSAYNYSDVRVAKGDFIRLKEISVSYNLPKSFAKRLKLSNLSIKLQATNLLLLYSDSKLNGADPEFVNTGGVASPIPHQFTATLRIGI